MKNKKIFIKIICLIGITMMFFSYKVVITHDSSHYLYLTSILEGIQDFSKWDIARGPIFPIIIRISNILFGKNVNGLLSNMFFFYILMIVFCYLIYKETIKNEEFFEKKFKNFIFILFFILVVINPMVIGYYHTLLTEYVAMSFATIGCYLSWKWMEQDYIKNKIKYVLYTVMLAILTVVSWQLKQPYISTIFFPIIVATLISFIRNKKMNNFIQRFTTILVCIIFLITSTKIWNLILEKNNIERREDRTSSSFIANGIISGLAGYDTREYAIPTKYAINFWISEFKKNPIWVMNKYVINYLATISIYNIEFDKNKIIINNKIDITNTAEIEDIGYKIYEYGNECIYPIVEEYSKCVEEYREVNKPIVAFNWIMRKLIIPDTIAMKFSYLILPLLMIISIIMVFKTKRGYTKKYNRLIDVITILYAYSFFNILVYAFLGSTIDRYTMPSLITNYIGILLSIYAIVYRKKYKIENLQDSRGKGDKIENEKM